MTFSTNMLAVLGLAGIEVGFREAISIVLSSAHSALHSRL